MSDSLPKTTSHGHADHLGVDWDIALAQHEQTLRQLISKRLSGRGESSVDDVFQEVSLAAHFAPAGSVAPDKVESWLKQVAVNKVRDLWRKIERKDRLQSGLQQESECDSAPGPSPFEWVTVVERTEIIAEALNQLSDDERRAMKMKYLDGQSCLEIARHEGVNAKAVEYRLGKARQMMRTILGKQLDQNTPTE